MIKARIYTMIGSAISQDDYGSTYSIAGFEQKEEREENMNSIPWSQGLINSLARILKTGILLTDTRGYILFTNHLATEILGYPKDSLNQKSIEALFLPEDTQIFLPNILTMTRDNTPFEGEVLLRKKDGDSFFVNLSTAFYKEEFTGYEFMIFTLQDITHYKKMEKEYHESERFIGLGRMTDQISHQIRNPIASIGGFALRLAKGGIPREEAHQYTQIIHNEAKRLEYIIDRLVEFAQVQTPRYYAFTLSEIFEGIRKAFERDLSGKPQRLQLPEGETLPAMTFYGNPAFIIRAVQCIVQNSLEACSSQGEVTVSWEMKENQILIRVTDNGEGIPAEHFPLIFDPFFTTKFNNLGLGLTMAKRIVHLHNGRIKVDSMSNKGTEVSIILPKDRRREIRTRPLPQKPSTVKNTGITGQGTV
jgi:PAS domain S-box-containing protein